MLAATESDSELVHETLPEDDPRVRQPDISRAREILEWEPKVTLEEGLRLTVPYFEQKIRETGNDSTAVRESD